MFNQLCLHSAAGKPQGEADELQAPGQELPAAPILQLQESCRQLATCGGDVLGKPALPRAALMETKPLCKVIVNLLCLSLRLAQHFQPCSPLTCGGTNMGDL